MCERSKTDSVRPTDVLASWEDGQYNFFLRKDENETKDLDLPSPVETNSGFIVDKVYKAGLELAVWKVGSQAMLKVQSRFPDTTTEDVAIDFVKKIAPELPVPEVIHAWNGKDRSFMLYRRMEGTNLQDAWESLSPEQRDLAAETVADWATALAQHASEKLQSVTENYLPEGWLNPKPGNRVGLGPWTNEEAAKHFASYPVEDHAFPVLDGKFYFYHPGLSPESILVSNGRVSGILDWDMAGYYPRFWIATKPARHPAFVFDPSIPGCPDTDWNQRLSSALEKRGFPQFKYWYGAWYYKASEELRCKA